MKQRQADGRLLGYARVSTAEQSLDMQRDALRRAGVPEDRIYSEQVSAVSDKRRQLDLLMSKLSQGDVLVVWKLDRLARSVSDLIRKVQMIERRGARLKSLTEGIDTSTAMGNLLLHVLGAVAQFERDLISERTSAGMQARKARGLQIGRERKIDVAAAERMLREGKSVSHIASHMGVTSKAIYRYFNGSAISELRRRGTQTN